MNYNEAIHYAENRSERECCTCYVYEVRRGTFRVTSCYVSDAVYISYPNYSNCIEG